jgi:TldD protein
MRSAVSPASPPTWPSERERQTAGRRPRATRAYTEYWATPIQKDPDKMSQDDKQALVQKVVDTVLQNKDVVSVNAVVGIEHEWKYFASTDGSYIEQELWSTTPSFTVTARKNGETRSRTYTGEMMTGGWDIVERAQMVENAERIAAEAVEFCTAKPVEMGVKDLVLTPSHAMLTIHEIVGHATELDRILGYERTTPGRSFIKISDIGKLKYGSKLFNITADRTIPGGVGTVGYDDDGVKTQQWPLVREGILVGLQTNREMAHLIGQKESRGCTSANSWRDYPFLRMPTSTSTPALPARLRRNRPRSALMWTGSASRENHSMASRLARRCPRFNRHYRRRSSLISQLKS